jgi:uncharacterized protein (DUF305 family)
MTAPVTAPSFAAGMRASMDRMMRDMHAAGDGRDADIDFLAMMIPHHVGAVDMARLVLIHGRDPATRRLAEDIIAGQQVEIEGMQRRLAQLRGGPRHTAGVLVTALGGKPGPPREEEY